jgi:hypothetical protein
MRGLLRGTLATLRILKIIPESQLYFIEVIKKAE